MTRTVFIVAGEASGDMYGGMLARSMRDVEPGLSLVGIGGDEMAAAGVELLLHVKDLSVMGTVELLGSLGAIRRAMATLVSEMKARRPTGLVTIDFPGFNLRLAQKVSPLGVPCVYYVPPKVWAWGRWRLGIMRRHFRMVLAIFPFEEEFYRREGIPVSFVGNPLIELLAVEDKDKLRRRYGVGEGDLVVGLLPGSRPGEVRRILPAFLDAAGIMRGALGGRAVFMLPRAHTVPKELLEQAVSGSGVAVTVTEGGARDVLSLSAVSLVASGTATLEAFLMGVPQVVGYRTSWPTYLVGRLIVKVPSVSLPNILAGRQVVQELLQTRLTGKELAGQALELLSRNDLKRDYIMAGIEVRSALMGHEASRIAARKALEAFGG